MQRLCKRALVGDSGQGGVEFTRDWVVVEGAQRHSAWQVTKNNQQQKRPQQWRVEAVYLALHNSMRAGGRVVWCGVVVGARATVDDSVSSWSWLGLGLDEVRGASARYRSVRAGASPVQPTDFNHLRTN